MNKIITNNQEGITIVKFLSNSNIIFVITCMIKYNNIKKQPLLMVFNIYSLFHMFPALSGHNLEFMFDINLITFKTIMI